MTSWTMRNFKSLVMTTNLFSMGRILPLLPPCVYGIYVLFGAFWPNRMVFFNSNQRRSHMSNRLQSWTLALVVLIVACLINSLIIQEIVQLLDENISIAKV